MSLYKRKGSKIFWINITTPDGKQRIRETTRTKNRVEAQEYHDHRKSEIWREYKLDEKPKRTWDEAVVKYINDKNNDDFLKRMRYDLIFLEDYFGEKYLDEIDKELIDDAIFTRRKSTYTRKEGGKEYSVTSKTVNHMIEMINAILNHARKCEWLYKLPNIQKLCIPNAEKKRMKWLTHAEFNRLVNELPIHLIAPVTIAVTTGLRESNITLLEWHQVDLINRIAWIHQDQSKAGKMIEIPLNDDAFKVLSEQKGKHPVRIFTYKGKPLRRINGLAFKKALDRAKIAPVRRDDVKNYPKYDLSEYKYTSFPEHSLRHTFASWHVQAGTPLAILQKLGGWASYEMVLRYAHLATNHTAAYANNICISSDLI